ncbi:uncharacterized protein LOC121889964 [Scomber scombrus]|uniref:Uncharacterized protein LOC121889964 n=1 Tax=Scomber scombrus TaxID=13677 RepID=A0AAV1Q4R0_SCOSC
MAIDESPGSRGTKNTCASVPLQDNPWWRVDLRSIYRITGVAIFSLGDCCSEELNHAEIRIGFRNDTNNQRCAVISTTKGQTQYTYQCGIMDGRFVHVVLPGLKKTLTICEIYVYGSVLENVALRGIASQSSRRWRTAGFASSVLDGNMITTCSETEDKPGQWVKVDLLVPYKVTIIQLALKKSCYVDKVLLDNSSCLVIPSEVQDLVTVDCGGTEGRYVTVMLPDNPPLVCEVEVYSTWKNAMNKVPQRPDPSGHCPFSYCSREYVLIQDQPMTWFEAQTYCRKGYTDLATINNVQDMNKAAEKMANGLTDFWIGLHEDAGTWKWSDGSESSFRYCLEGQPNSLGKDPNCARVNGDKWSAKSCNTKSMFLCYYYKKKSLVRIQSDFDMSDPVVQQQILTQLEAEMKKKGISDFKIRWKTSGG